MTKIVKTLDTNLHGSLQSMICQQVTLSGDAEWPKVADAVIEARKTSLTMRHRFTPAITCSTTMRTLAIR
jgi:hypothetical protein